MTVAEPRFCGAIEIPLTVGASGACGPPQSGAPLPHELCIPESALVLYRLGDRLSVYIWEPNHSAQGPNGVTPGTAMNNFDSLPTKATIYNTSWL